MVRLTLGFWILLAGLSGAAGLMRQPMPARGKLALAIWSALAGTLAPVGVWVVAWLSAGQADLRALAIAAGTGFFLAAVFAPLLRARRAQPKSWIISEDSDERKDDR